MKFLFDKNISALGLIVLSPIMALIAFMIKLKMPDGPVIFKQSRVGREGKVFTSMVKDYLSPEIASMPGTTIRPEPYYGLFTGAILIRKSVFDEIGPFSEDRRTGEIIEWQSRMDKFGFLIKKTGIVSTDRRIHNTNFGKTNKGDEYKDYASVLRQRLMMIRK
jgi:hypothetical protein